MRQGLDSSPDSPLSLIVRISLSWRNLAVDFGLLLTTTPIVLSASASNATYTIIICTVKKNKVNPSQIKRTVRLEKLGSIFISFDKADVQANCERLQVAIVI